jgi:dynein light intermediate chain 1
MATPWSIIEQLQFWAGILHDHVDSLKISPDNVKEFREKCVRRWLDYVEPGDEMELSAASKTTTATTNRGSRNLEEEEEPVLPSHILSRNTGLDIVVVVTKTDYISTLERDNDYKDENFDFIQFHIRQFCIQYGAALFYTSVKEDKNCDLLYKYLVHRMYGLPFKTPALIVEKDAVFIPAGWDNEKKMAILHENMSSFKPDDYYNNVIQKPVVRKNVSREVEVEVVDEQSFLERQLGTIQQQALNPRNPGLTPSPYNHQGKQSTPRTPNVSPLPGITPKKSGDAANPSDRVLANFFNSLLSRKSGSSPGSPNKSSGDDTRSEVAEELDSMLNKKNMKSLNSSDC